MRRIFLRMWRLLFRMWTLILLVLLLPMQHVRRLHRMLSLSWITSHPYLHRERVVLRVLLQLHPHLLRGQLLLWVA